MEQLETENTPNSVKRTFWLILLFLSFIGLIVASGWFIKERDFEPLFTLIGALATFFTILFYKGLKGLLFGLGIVVGAVIATLLLLYVPQFGSKEIKTELTQTNNEKKNVEDENILLKRKISELETVTVSPTPQTPNSTPTPTSSQTPISPPIVNQNTESNLIKNYQDVEVKLISTRLNGSNQTINLKLKSSDVARRIKLTATIRPQSIIISDGKEYTAKSVSLAGRGDSYSIEKDINADISYDVQFEFTNVPNNIQNIDIFDMFLRVNNEQTQLKFLNLKPTAQYAK